MVRKPLHFEVRPFEIALWSTAALCRNLVWYVGTETMIWAWLPRFNFRCWHVSYFLKNPQFFCNKVNGKCMGSIEHPECESERSSAPRIFKHYYQPLLCTPSAVRSVCTLYRLVEEVAAAARRTRSCDISSAECTKKQYLTVNVKGTKTH
jgi:hypothetical protein